MCLAGFGTFQNSASGVNTCSGCRDGYYNPGDSVSCLTCGNNALFIYPGKQDAVTFRPTSKPGSDTQFGARTTDECYPLMVQMDESMGTHLIDTTVFINSGGNPPGGSVTGASSAQACADSCAGNCIAATFIYTRTSSDDENDKVGRCLQIPASGGTPLYVKVLPLDYVSGASVGKKKNSTGLITGQAAVASGHFVLWGGASPSLLGIPHSSFPGTVQNCRATCSTDSSCWGFFFSGGTCDLRRGFQGEGHRTFLRTVVSQLA